jgi:macrolide phosphotransferase
MDSHHTIALAARHGLLIREDIHFNEMGLDFKVGFATDKKGGHWVLRIPRRPDLGERIKTEKAILELVKEYLSVDVPNWRIVSEELIAYPLLPDPPVLEFDPKTYEVTWGIDPENSRYTLSFAQVLRELQQVPIEAGRTKGLKTVSIDRAREEILADIDWVRRELDINPALETRWRRWVDNDTLWPSFTTFVHGDLYAGHVLARKDGSITGVIDWSEGQFNDPSIDFTGQVATFGEKGLRELITEYRKLGGPVWENLFEHTLERYAAAPLKYAVFALTVKSDFHLEAAKSQLMQG